MAGWAGAAALDLLSLAAASAQGISQLPLPLSSLGKHLFSTAAGHSLPQLGGP